MAPADDGTTPAADPMAEETEEGAGGRATGLGPGGSSYVPPHMRKGAREGAGERMGGKYEKDDLATLRVTNVCHSILVSSGDISPARFHISQTNTLFTS